MEDDVMARVTAAVGHGQAGEQEAARREPESLGSLADDHRRPGDAERARGFLEQARAASDALGDDAYGDLVRGILDRVGRAPDEGSTAPLPDA